MSQKVLLVCGRYWDSNSAVYKRMKAYKKALVKSGYSCSVLSDSPVDDRDCKGFIKIPFTSYAPYWSFMRRLLGEVIVGFSFLFWLLYNRKKHDIIVCSSPSFVAIFILVVASGFFERRYVLDIRDRYPEVLFGLKIINRDSVIGRFLLYCEKILYKKAKLITVATEGIRKGIYEDFGMASHVVLNGHDFGDLSMNCSKPESTDRPFVVVSHGTFGELFDFDGFEAVVRRVTSLRPQINFHVFGMGAQLAKLRDLDIPQLKVSGACATEQVFKNLQEASLGLSMHKLNPSILGSFPVKVFDFVGAQLPSIVVPLSEGGIYIKDNGLGWSYGPEELDAISDQIIKLHDEGCPKDMLARLEESSSSLDRRLSAEKLVTIARTHGILES